MSDEAESRFLDWNPERDLEHIRPSARVLRERSARHQVARSPQRSSGSSDLVHWRRGAIRIFELLIGRPISGRVLEIGAGAGWCAGYLSRSPEVSEVYALDYEPYCVGTLMPHVHAQQGADIRKITRVLGSYNVMDSPDGFFHFVVSMGALHHSEALDVTLQECARVMSPGGYLFALERCEPNSLTRERELFLENQILSQEKQRRTYGDTLPSDTVVREKDYSNHYYRLMEYEVCSLRAGLHPDALIFDSSPTPNHFALGARMLRSLLFRSTLLRSARSYTGFSKRVLYPYFARGAYRRRLLVYDRLMLVARKMSVS